MKPFATKELLESTSILVVDDDAMVRDILVEHLNNFGFKNVFHAKDGKAGLKYIQDHKTPIDIVISDWEMPGASGLTLLKAIRQHPTRSQCKFIMVTSQVSRERVKISQALLWRVDAYIVKPFRGDVLKEKLIEVMGWQDPDLTQKTGS